MKRTGRLKAYAPLERHTPLPRMSAKKVVEHALRGFTSRSTLAPSRPKPAVPDDVRAALAERSDGWCEAQIQGVCTGRAIDPHHRIGQQSGGRHGEAKERSDRLSNTLYLCRACHSWTHRTPFGTTNPLGLVLRQCDIPAHKAVLYRGHTSYLADDGRVASYEEVGA